MRYMGSKNKLSKHIIPIIQNYIDETSAKGYIEPFVGGANIIDKISAPYKLGCDAHTELIHLLRYVQKDGNWKDIPDRILCDEYKLVREDSKKSINDRKYPLWYTGFVGFCSSFGAKYFGGYARNKSTDQQGEWSQGAIKNLKKQSGKELFKDIIFKNMPFQSIPVDKIKNCVIYCDPPYKGTTQYSVSKNFPYEEFYDWCIEMNENNIVLISEYDMPEDRFKCIWEKEHSTHIDSKKEKGDKNKKNKRLEKIFIVK